MPSPNPRFADMPTSLRVTVHALRSGLHAMPGLPPHLECVWLLLLEERFQEALQALAESKDPTDTAQCMHRLIRNMQAAHDRRPALYASLRESMETDHFNQHFRPQRTKCDEWSIMVYGEDEDPHILRHHDHPREAALEILRQIDLDAASGRPVLLAGIGDGYLLDSAWRLPTTVGHAESAWGIIEIEIELVLACFQLHEWDGPRGPIQRANFFWVVGEHALARVEKMYTQEWMMPAPLAILGTKILTDETQRIIGKAQVQRAENAAVASAQLIHSAHPSPRLLLANAQAQRTRPRALLIHDHNDIEAREISLALSRLSWDVRDLAPETNFQAINPEAIVHVMAHYPPDIAVGIGDPILHHPHHVQAGIPLLRWAVGPQEENDLHSVRADDFLVNTHPLLDTWTESGRNQIWLPGVMRERCEIPATSPARFSLTLAAAAPESPRILLDRAMAQCSDSHEQACLAVSTRALLRSAVNGQICITACDLEQLIHSACPVVSEPQIRQLALWLNPLADALYLLQTAEWVAMVGRSMHLPTCFAGEGWRQYDFASDFTQANLTVEEAAAASTFTIHSPRGFALDQAMLNLLAAGHFTLVRDHPAHHHLPALASFLGRFAPKAKDEHELAATCHAAQQQPMASMLRSTRCLLTRPIQGPPTDPVHLCQQASHLGLLEVDGEIMPSWSRLTFDSPETLEHAVRDWMGSPAQRYRQMILSQECLARRMGTRRQLTHVLQHVARTLAPAA